MRFELCLSLAALAACSGKDSAKRDAGANLPIRLDAGIITQHVATGPVGDPSGMHLDDSPTTSPVNPPTASRTARDIEITLRSSPPGARVSVDGTVLGNTPAFCNCKADGREHEFLFTLPGHAIARYRFVPVSSGVIHARLDPIAEEPDGGVPPPEVVPPQAAPTPVAPPVPLAPVDAAMPSIDAAPPREPTLGPQP